MVRTISFVALGNSLTVGFIPEAFPMNYPYTEFLKEMIDDFLEELGNDTAEIKIINIGINGELTGDMLLRFRRDVIALKPNYVIILGGTNDIGWGVPVEEIFSGLAKMFQMAIDNRIEPIGCTVPSVLGWDEGIQPRLRLNELLMRFCHEKEILCADIFAKTCDPETRRLRADYSSDGLHLNVPGYRRMAETIFEEAIKTILIRELDVYQK
jgi:lysophospholipase L1-like esterase